jgi:hypothetical protein
MNHRQRVLTALQHQEPDRVPLDLGGTADSTVVAVAYRKLRAHPDGSPAKFQPQFQQDGSQVVFDAADATANPSYPSAVWRRSQTRSSDE